MNTNKAMMATSISFLLVTLLSLWKVEPLTVSASTACGGSGEIGAYSSDSKKVCSLLIT
jgi:hypothetical protein